MITGSVNIYEVIVQFDPTATTNQFSYTGDIDPKGWIKVQPGISLINFTLDSPPGVAFPGTPIQWLKGGQPTALPSSFLMHWHDELHFALWDFNSSPAGAEHNFVVSVFYENKFYSSHDPSIVNDPPG